MNHLMIFSAIYLVVASMSPVLGYLALRFDPKNSINRSFAVISLCLMLWALGFSVLVIAPDEASAQFWTKISSIGYGMIYSVFLHFTLVITGHNKVLEKKWFLFLLYLPAAFCLYAFVISPNITGFIYLFENTGRGWIRTTPFVIYDYVFHAYYVTSVSSSLLLFAFWKRKNSEEIIKKQANILILSFLTALGLGTLTDVANGLYFNLPLPQMAPFLLLIPLAAIFYCVKKYHFMRPVNVDKMEMILDDERRIFVFKITSNLLILIGITLFVMGHFWWMAESPVLTTVSSILLIALGGILRHTRLIKRGYACLEFILVVIGITVTPALTINMMQFGAVATWTFAVMLIICALLFNSNTMLVAATATAIISQAYLMGIMPQRYVMIDYRTYSSRIVVLLFITIAIYYIHRIYMERLRENAAQAKTQKLISDLASGFSLTGQNDATQRAHGIHDLLVTLSDYFIAETVLINVIEDEFIDLIGIGQHSIGDRMISPSLLSERWGTYLRENSIDRETPPPASQSAADQFTRMLSTPWIFIPIYKDEQPVAFFYIETSREENIWTKDQLVPLPIISRIVSDTLEQLSSEAQIRFMAYYDSLTALPNRQLFYDRAEQAIHVARRNNAIVAIMFMDLDSFKSINDTMGHEGGDKVIQAISKRLSENLRKTDTVTRFGGDEFLILLNNISDAEDITKVAAKVLGAFREPFVLKGQEIFVTASAGISVYPADGEDAETLIKHADIAMYTAKEKGKNQCALCSPNMKETVAYRVNLTNNLYRALNRDELQVYYQPQIDLKTERITGLEALLRWRHPEYGMIPPLEFISLAEQTGLINPIGNWVLETACAQAVEWKSMGFGDLRISVNLSVVQLRNPDLLNHINQILEKTGIEPSQVELEITESTTTKEPDYIIRVLNDLKSLGVSISIDDFGTEYSSLNRLKMLPVDRLKMDIQFVRGIDKSPKDQAISLVIINLAKNLDLKLTAEGVENITQLDFLRNRMCDEVQGFYYYKPMPPCEIEKILKSRSAMGA